MKLLQSTEKKTTKDKNGENVPQLEVIEVVVVQCNIVNNDHQHDSRKESCIYSFAINHLVNY